MSHIDEKIKGEVWDAKITVMFILAPSEITTHAPPRPYYASLRRLSYFAFICEKLKRHFSEATIETQEGDIWLDYSNQPIRWHLPIGVLHDTLNVGGQLPWCITVHFRNFPPSIMHCGQLEQMKWAYTNTLKEAMFMRHGNASAVNALSMEDQELLFISIRDNKFRKFWDVNQVLLDHDTNYEICKYVPIRFVFRNLQQPCIQKPIPPLDENDQEHTLRSCMNVMIPQLINSQQMQLSSPDETMSGVHCSVHGVPISLDTPLVWLMNHCAHADNFVYVVTSISANAFVECLSGIFS